MGNYKKTKPRRHSRRLSGHVFGNKDCQSFTTKEVVFLMEVSTVAERALNALNNARQHVGNSSEATSNCSTTSQSQQLTSQSQQLSALQISNMFRDELDRSRTTNIVRPRNTPPKCLNVAVTCLDKPRNNLIGLKMKELAKRGIGPFKKVGDHGRSKVSFPLNSTEEQFKNQLLALYPALSGVPFHLSKSDIKRNLIKLSDSDNTPYAIKNNNTLKRSCLYIVPERPLSDSSNEQRRRRVSLDFSDLSSDESEIIPAGHSMQVPVPSNSVTPSLVTSNIVTLNSVTPSSVTLNSVTPSSVTLNSVTPSSVTLNSVTPSSVTLNSVTPSSVTLNSVTPSSVTLNSVTPSSVTLNSVTPSSVTLNSVTPSSVTLNSVTPSSVTSNSVTPISMPINQLSFQELTASAFLTEWDFHESTIIKSRQELELAQSSVREKLDNFNGSLNQTGILYSEHLYFKRESIYNEMMQLYENNSLLTQKTLFVTFLGEEGIDLGGVTREAFSLFWDSCFKDFFKGSDAKVPFLPLSRQEDNDKFKTIGLIFGHYIALMKALPTEICRTTLMSKIYNKDKISDELLMEDFLLYLTPAERKLAMQALSATTFSDHLFNELIAFYQHYDLQSIPCKSKIHCHMIKIAKNELIFKPMFLMSEIFNGLTETQELFLRSLTLAEIESLYIMARPTPEKVVESLKTDVDEDALTNKQETTLYFLKNYIRNLSVKDLSTFLKYVTGTSSLPKQISVSFKRGEGLGRAPHAKTCTQNIIVSENFSTFQEFADLFDAVLQEKENFILSLA